MRLLLTNAHIISPGVALPSGSILIEDASVLQVGQDLSPADADEVHDLGGAMALPGFIDIHTHGAGGHDFGEGTEEAVREFAKAKLREGVTTFLPTTLTLPREPIEQMMRAAAAYRENQDAAKVPAVHIEGPYINAKCAGAQNPAYVRPPDSVELLDFHKICPVGVVSVAVETEGGMPFVSAMRKAGITTSLAHTAATYGQFKEAKAAGLTHLTHFCNQMTPLHHREVGLVGAGLLDPDVMIEMICDTIHLAPDMILLAFTVKAQSLDQIMLITDSVAGSGMPEGSTYNLAGLDVSVKDGACRLSDGTLAGSTLQLNQALKNVHVLTGVPLRDLVCTTSFNQARSLGFESLGSIESGARADIAVLDENFDVTMTLVDGQIRYRR
jgi:N-acetylglucosamine-6-phosphate deacetylase